MSTLSDGKNVSSGKVLFVDDEINILKSIARSFLNAEFEVFTATSAEEGLKVLENQDIDIVVTDYRMPSMDGFQFLGIVKVQHPRVNRVILSGFIEKSAAVESLTRGIASTYILKPWMNAEVEEKINHILETRKLLKSNRLLGVINRIETLPTLTNTYRDFIAAVAQERSMADITKIIQRDPSVATKVLHIANSAFYGLKNCSSVGHAAVTIGLDTLHDILLTLSVIGTSAWNRNRIECLKEIFTNSVIMNAMLPELYRQKNGSHLQKNFPSVGLTYDVGKVLLLQYFPERFEETLKKMEKCGEVGRFYETEISFGFSESSHQEIGAFFLDFWNLPAVFVETALYHHTPAKASVHYRDVVEVLGFIDLVIDRIRACGAAEEPDPQSLPQGFFPMDQTADIARGIRKRLNALSLNFPLPVLTESQDSSSPR